MGKAERTSNDKRALPKILKLNERGSMQDDRNIPIPEKKRRKRRLSPKIVEAVRLLASGEVPTQKLAAERVGVTETWLSTMLGREETRVLLEQTVRKCLHTGTVRASARLIQLLDSDSSRTALEASKHVLAIGGHAPPREGGVNISIGGNDSPGYVVVLRHRDDPGLRGDDAQLLDITPNAEHASAAALASSKAYSR